MKINKKGFIFNASHTNTWMHSHAMIPTPVALNDEVIRIYTTFCDQHGIGRPGYVDVSMENPSDVIAYSQTPLFEIGASGNFDDNGAVLCSVTALPNGALYGYYVGFELYQKVRYKLFTGLAIRKTPHDLFQKLRETPILDRSPSERCFRCGPFCIYDENRFKLWYIAGSNWININGIHKPTYIIKYLESEDGISWDPEGEICIDILEPTEHGFGRPYVIKRHNKYHMFYSIRNEETGYRLGYASSLCGKKWQRNDNRLNLGLSPSGWDSEMLCYAAPFQTKHKTYLFYNGNNFGQSGFGYAELEWDDE